MDRFTNGKFPFSYSSASAFDTCKYSFKLTYMEKKNRAKNFFSDYGSFIHAIIEMYFRGELDIFTMSGYYEEHYYEWVVSKPPPFQKTMAEGFYKKGLEFFDGFCFDKDDYELLMLEEKVVGEVGGFHFVVKPDMVLKEKKTGKIILMDVKTANPYKPNGKLDIKKVTPYAKQLALYAYFIEIDLNIKIDEKIIWFTKSGNFENVTSLVSNEEALAWFKETVGKIFDEEKWEHDLSSAFFCDFLCSVRMDCEFRGEKKNE